MGDVEGFPVGDYMVMPSAEELGDGKWQACVFISGPGTGEGGRGSWKYEHEHAFISREGALKYARERGELMASDPDKYL
ncbi:hypothetical protein [Eleftheria terrae]|uniref:hypothetical protein n=1 Tax=Eleftheria terrae TaxID=1597781 RepID=UPI00263BA428|nr:hypothetical protein [Eleftheria terrae]WKB52901.1 hypothetical protein N7L95_00420 [Eleftheria terrae]